MVCATTQAVWDCSLERNRVPRLKLVLVATVLAAQMLIASPANATVMNGKFDTMDFTGWTGLTIDVFSGPDVVTVPATGPNFDASSGAGVLTTSSATDPFGNFVVNIFQTFVMDPLAGADDLILSYDLSVLLSDPFFDSFTAVLNVSDGMGGFVLDEVLSEGTGVEVSVGDLAGQTVQLAFGLIDFDGGIFNFFDEDVLTVDNIMIMQRFDPTAVPAPGVVGLFAFGLLVSGALRRRRGAYPVRA